MDLFNEYYSKTIYYNIIIYVLYYNTIGTRWIIVFIKSLFFSSIHFITFEEYCIISLASVNRETRFGHV